MTMTLESVRDWHRKHAQEIAGLERIFNEPDYRVAMHNSMADAIDAHLAHLAHLTQPTQSVDVEKVREVIAELSRRGNTGFNTNDRARCSHWADKLTAALQEKGK